MKVLLCDTKIVVRQQSGIATSTAPLVILCHFILVLVFWQLDSDTVTMCTSARAVQDRMLRKMICVPRLPDESAETHMTRWAILLRNCRAKHKFPRGDETYFASYFSWCGHVALLSKADPQRETRRIYVLKIWNGCGI